MDTRRPITLRGEEDEYDLGTILGALKERGCSILVTGEAPITTLQSVGRRLFGHPEERRERVLIRLRPTNTLEEWFPADVGPDKRGVRIVDCTAPIRSVVANDFEGLRWDSEFDPTETPALSRRSDIDGCVDEIDAVVAGAGPLAPAQLRVGLYSLGVLDGHAEMIDVVSAVSPTVTAHGGMVHYHLQQPPTSEAARAVLDHVDGMVSVRKHVPDEPPLQKWTIPGYGESPWIPLDRYE